MPVFRSLAVLSGLLLPMAAQAADHSASHAATHHAAHHRPARVQTATYKTPLVKHRQHDRMASHTHRDHLAQLHRHSITRGS